MAFEKKAQAKKKRKKMCNFTTGCSRGTKKNVWRANKRAILSVHQSGLYFAKIMIPKMPSYGVKYFTNKHVHANF